MKTLLILSLFIFSTTASAYCVRYDVYGQCAQQDQYSQQNQNNQNNTYNNLGIKPLPVIPPIGTKNCNWVAINNQWQSVCR